MLTVSEFELSGYILDITHNKSGGAILMLKTGDSEKAIENDIAIPTYFSPNFKIIIPQRVLKKYNKAGFLKPGNGVYVRGRAYAKKVIHANRPFHVGEIRAEMLRPGRFQVNRFTLGGRLESIDVRNSGAVMVKVRCSMGEESEVGRGDGNPKFYSPIVPVLLNKKMIQRIGQINKMSTAQVFEQIFPVGSDVAIQGYLTSTRADIGEALYKVELHGHTIELVTYRKKDSNANAGNVVPFERKPLKQA